VSRRAVQDWEAGVNHPSAQRLQALILVLLEAGGLTARHEALEAGELWAAVLRETPRMQTPFDHGWFAGLVSAGVAPRPVRGGVQSSTAEAGASTTVERVQDWGEAPDVLSFGGRADELASLRSSVLEERCRLVAVLGMGGIGKTILAARRGADRSRSAGRGWRAGPSMSQAAQANSSGSAWSRVSQLPARTPRTGTPFDPTEGGGTAWVEQAVLGALVGQARMALRLWDGKPSPEHRSAMLWACLNYSGSCSRPFWRGCVPRHDRVDRVRTASW
jgi:hypothetical protein